MQERKALLLEHLEDVHVDDVHAFDGLERGHVARAHDDEGIVTGQLARVDRRKELQFLSGIHDRKIENVVFEMPKILEKTLRLGNSHQKVDESFLDDENHRG